jgi:streptogramin lyase
VDPGGGAVWAAGESSTLSKWDPRTGQTRTFQLPVYFVPGNVMRCPVGAKCEGATMYTKVSGIAVAPNGDVYFSDATMNRIGVIKAGQ